MLVRPPPNLTNSIQLIDANVGKAFRNDVCTKIEAYIEKREDEILRTQDSIARATIELKSMKKRQLVAEITARVLAEWRTDESKMDMIKRAADRTGLAMCVDSNNPELRPQKFPVDFGLSVSDSTHPMHGDIVPFSFGAQEPVHEDVEDMMDGRSEEEESVWLEKEVVAVDEEAKELLKNPREAQLTLGSSTQEQNHQEECSTIGDEELSEGESSIQEVLQRRDNEIRVLWSDGCESWIPLDTFFDDDGKLTTSMIVPFLTSSKLGRTEGRDLARGEKVSSLQSNSSITQVSNNSPAFNNWTTNAKNVTIYQQANG